MDSSALAESGARRGWRKSVAPTGLAAVLLIFAVGAGGSSAVRHRLADAAPPDAVAAINDLASQDLGRVRAAVSGAIAPGITSPTAVLPAGAALIVDERSWHRDGDFASVDVTMTAPGRRPERHHVTLVREDGRWRILVTEQ